jgi:hypothetical protein
MPGMPALMPVFPVAEKQVCVPQCFCRAGVESSILFVSTPSKTPRFGGFQHNATLNGTKIKHHVYGRNLSALTSACPLTDAPQFRMRAVTTICR